MLLEQLSDSNILIYMNAYFQPAIITSDSNEVFHFLNQHLCELYTNKAQFEHKCFGLSKFDLPVIKNSIIRQN